MSTYNRNVKKAIQATIAYNKGSPIMSDADYDNLMLLIREEEADEETIISPFSPTQKVSYLDPDTHLSTVKREKPMLSLDNLFTPAEVIDWCTNIARNASVSARYKLDGLALELSYVEGKLETASTRGDGLVGEDVTLAAIHVANIPTVLSEPIDLIVRGEVVIGKDLFALLNKDGAYANERNYAAGSLRLKDPTRVKERELKFYAYYVDNAHSSAYPSSETTYAEQMETLELYGFVTAPKALSEITLDSIEEVIQEKREELDVVVDGIVLTIDDLEEQKRLGATGRVPRWAIAYKFPAEAGDTQVNDVVWQIGRHGTHTPVAKTNPVRVCGVIIDSPTLHNADEIKRLGVRIGDVVRIERSGDVIPKITQVVINNPKGKDIEIPTHCVCCGSKLENVNGDVALRCTRGHLCEEQFIQHLTYITSRPVLDIKGLSEQTIRKWHSEGKLKTTADLFKLKVEADSTKPEIDAINKLTATKHVPLDRFLMSLGVYRLGKTASKIIYETLGTLENWYNTPMLTLVGLRMFTPERTLELVNWFGENEDYVRSLLAADCNLKLITKEPNYRHNSPKPINLKKAQKELVGFAEEDWEAAEEQLKEWGCYTNTEVIVKEVICVSGSIQGVNREDVKEHFEGKGYKVSSSVNSKTTMLIIGDNPSSNKVAKAKQLNIPVIEYGLF